MRAWFHPTGRSMYNYEAPLLRGTDAFRGRMKRHGCLSRLPRSTSLCLLDAGRMDPCHTVRIPKVTSSETTRQPLQERASTSSNALGSRGSESCRFRLLRFFCLPPDHCTSPAEDASAALAVLLRLEPHSQELSSHPPPRPPT